MSGALRKGERRILEALAETILGPAVPAPGTTRFSRDFAGLMDELAPRDRRALRGLLLVMQLSPLLLRGRTFTALEPSARERHLERLARSRLGPWRRGVAVAKSLVAYVYYAQPESWPAIGYGGPWLGRREIEVLPDPDLGDAS